MRDQSSDKHGGKPIDGDRDVQVPSSVPEEGSEGAFEPYRTEHAPVKPAFPGLICTLNKLATAVENECSLLPPTVKELVEEAKIAVREWNKYIIGGANVKEERPVGEEESRDGADGV